MEWGNAAEWVGGLATAAALVCTGVQINATVSRLWSPESRPNAPSSCNTTFATVARETDGAAL